MKKTLLSVAAIAAIVTTASAADWFNGNIGSTAAGGEWDSLPDGVTLTNFKFTLEDVESFKFTAASGKSLSSSENLNFASTVNFKYAYEELPEVSEGEKAGVIVYGSPAYYYVLAKDDTTNRWQSSNIEATTVDSEVAVSVVISNGNESAWAIYTIAGSTVTKEIAVPQTPFSIVDYSGCGTIASLVGSTILIDNGYPIPGNHTIATGAADAWAQDFGYDKSELAAILASTTTYAQGRTAAESCILGVRTNDIVNSYFVDDGSVAADKLGFIVDCAPIANHALFQLKKGNSAIGSAQAEPEFEIDLEEGEYTVVAYIDGANKEIPVSKTMGVKNAASSFASASSAGFCAVPYTGKDGDIAVSNLFKKACLANGDQLDVFDSATSGWKTFTFNGTAWAGVQKGSETPDPATTTIKRGQAFKLTRPNSVGLNRPVYLGYVATGSATVSLPSKKYELVAKPDGTNLPLSSVGANDWAVKVDVGAKLPNETYKKVGGSWKKITYSDGAPVQTDAANVEGAVFLLNRGDEAKNIEL